MLKSTQPSCNSIESKELAITIKTTNQLITKSAFALNLNEEKNDVNGFPPMLDRS